MTFGCDRYKTRPRANVRLYDEFCNEFIPSNYALYIEPTARGIPSEWRFSYIDGDIPPNYTSCCSTMTVSVCWDEMSWSNENFFTGVFTGRTDKPVLGRYMNGKNVVEMTGSTLETLLDFDILYPPESAGGYKCGKEKLEELENGDITLFGIMVGKDTFLSPQNFSGCDYATKTVCYDTPITNGVQYEEAVPKDVLDLCESRLAKISIVSKIDCDVEVGDGVFNITPLAVGPHSFTYQLTCDCELNPIIYSYSETAVAPELPQTLHPVSIIYGISNEPYKVDVSCSNWPCEKQFIDGEEIDPTFYKAVYGSEVNCKVVNLGGGLFDVTPLADGAYSFDYEMRCDCEETGVTETVTGFAYKDEATLDADLTTVQFTNLENAEVTYIGDGEFQIKALSEGKWAFDWQMVCDGNVQEAIYHVSGNTDCGKTPIEIAHEILTENLVDIGEGYGGETSCNLKPACFVINQLPDSLTREGECYCTTTSGENLLEKLTSLAEAGKFFFSVDAVPDIGECCMRYVVSIDAIPTNSRALLSECLQNVKINSVSLECMQKGGEDAVADIVTATYTDPDGEYYMVTRCQETGRPVHCQSRATVLVDNLPKGLTKKQIISNLETRAIERLNLHKSRSTVAFDINFNCSFMPFRDLRHGYVFDLEHNGISGQYYVSSMPISIFDGVVAEVGAIFEEIIV